MTRYVECGGLAALLRSVTTLANIERSSVNIYDAVQQLDCLCCLRALLSRRDGLEVFLVTPDHADHLVKCEYLCFVIIINRFRLFAPFLLLATFNKAIECKQLVIFGKYHYMGFTSSLSSL